MDTNSLQDVFAEALEPYLPNTNDRLRAVANLQSMILTFMARMPPHELVTYAARSVDLARRISVQGGDVRKANKAYTKALAALAAAGGRTSPRGGI